MEAWNCLTASGTFCSNRQMPGPEARAVAVNLLAALRFFGRALAGSEIQDLPDVALIFCGLNYAAFNAALVSGPLDNDTTKLLRLIQSAALRFNARNLRWTCWLCDDFVNGDLRHESVRLFARNGLRPLTEAPGMYAENLEAPRRELPALEVQPVADAAMRKAFARIMSVGFEIPENICLAVYGSERAWTGDFRGYVGIAGGTPVATAGACITGDTVGLYSVATVPAYRRHGYAEAIMRAAVKDAQTRAGVSRSVLQSTRSGLSLYQQMGYRVVTNFSVYIAD